MDKLPDWITAVATALTAIAAIGAGIIAFISYRKTARPPMPVIEPDFYWLEPTRGHFVGLNLVVRNQLYETITLAEIKVVRPRGMTFAEETQILHQVRGAGSIVSRIEVKIQRTPGISRKLSWEIDPLGTTTTIFRGSKSERIDRMDVHNRIFFFSPPDNWDGGAIRIELLLLSKALTIRPRRITIKRQITAAPKMQTDENASSVG